MICELVKYLHCSMDGSYHVPAILMAKNVPFDVNTHGSYVDQVYPKTCKNIGKTGVLITYFDPFIEEWVKNEWVTEDYIVIEPHVSTTRNHFY